MPAERRQTFWFAEEDNQALDVLVSRLQKRSAAKVSKAAAVRWAIDAANKELELMEAGEILTDRRKPHEEQIEAANKLGQAEKQYRPLAYEYLLQGLINHFDGYGPVQKSIVEALQKAGDEKAVLYLMKLRDMPPDKDVLEVTNEAIETLRRGHYTRSTSVKLGD